MKQQVEAAGGQVQLSTDGSFQTKPDVAVVVFGEDPYAEGHGDRENLDYQRGEKRDLALLRSLKEKGIPVVSVFISGRPLWVNAEMNVSDAFVAAWLPGSEGNGVAEVLLTNKDGAIQQDFKGKLSFSWPNSPNQAVVNRGDKDYAPLLPYGFGLKYGDKNVLNDDLTETVKVDSTQAKVRAFYTGKMHKPWQMKLVSGGQVQDIVSSTASHGAVSYRTVDREVQEDSLQLVLDGSAEAGLQIVSKSHFREDLLNDLTFNSALHFLVKVDELSDAPVSLTINCEGTGDEPGSCEESLDINKSLSELEAGQWQPFSVDLKCFADKGVKFTQIVRPFVLTSKGKAKLSLANIQHKPETAKDANISCQ